MASAAASIDNIPTALEPPLAPAYPRAAWRVAPPDAVSSAVLWISQIVIRHRDVRTDVSFSPAYWTSTVRPQRSRAEALALAEHVAELAAHEPARFAELARQYSDDPPSRDEGGALGGYAATQLTPWAHVLDALAALKSGQTSRVIETRYGFHVFYRAEPPPEEERSGVHIVIGHDDAAWLAMCARRPRPARSREEALALANDIYRQAEAHPERFSKLVRRYSEHRDAIADGDFGAWSTRERNGFPLRAKRLAELTVEQVGKPVETQLGFEIIQRTMPRARSQYRAAIHLIPIARVDGDAPKDPTPAQRDEALSKAKTVAERLSKNAGSFDSLETSVEQWAEGRANPELTLAIAHLRPGEVTRDPVDTEFGYVFAKRLEPEPMAIERFTAELPTPDAAGLDRFLGALELRDARDFLRTFAVGFARERSLDASLSKRLIAAQDLNETPRLPKMNDVFARTRTVLGTARNEQYQVAFIQSAAMLPSPVYEEQGSLGL
ncbi:MAG TPA: peptidylprolyl isomerase [Polyangiaceae bacterium]|nr:peptidylprolyl isomerase [Polyangiaceae bacterium]